MNLTYVIAAVVIAVIFLFAIADFKKKALNGKNQKRKNNSSPITQKTLLSINEQPMYFRLKEALPDCNILAQVSFSALLTTKSLATRNTFDRKVADFVICTKSFQVLAIVELDDSSHKEREQEDAARDLLLTNAGYRVLRYKQVPDIEKLVADVSGINKNSGIKPEQKQEKPEINVTASIHKIRK